MTINSYPPSPYPAGYPAGYPASSQAGYPAPSGPGTMPGQQGQPHRKHHHHRHHGNQQQSQLASANGTPTSLGRLAQNFASSS